MKTMKRFGAVLCAMAMVISLAACGGTSAGGGNDEDNAAAIAAAVEKANDASSMEAVMSMDLAMSMDDGMGGSVTFSMGMDMDMVAFMDPMKVLATTTITLDAGEYNAMLGFGEPIVAEMIITEDTMYMDYEGTWIAQPMDGLADMDQYNPQASVDLYLNGANSFKNAGSDTVNGVSATKYTGVLSGAALEEAMNASGIMESIDNMGLTGGMSANDLYANLGDMSIIIWVDGEGYPIRYEMDMKDMLAEAMGEEEVTIDRALITMDVTNYNGATDFEIPADALSY